MRFIVVSVCLIVATACVVPASAATLNVGPTRTYTTMQAAIDAASSDDTILVDPGTYVGTACTMAISGSTRNNLTIQGNGDRPVLDMGPDVSVSVNGGLGICSVGSAVDGLTFENLAFANAADSSTTSVDAAAIYWNGIGQLTVRDCEFHDCAHAIRAQNKAATSTPITDILVDRCKIYDCGIASPATHSINIGLYVNSFTLQYSWVYNCKGTSLVMTQGKSTKLLYNRIGEEITDAGTSPVTWGGSGETEIDIRYGGLSYLIGNMITKRPGATNGTLVKYGGSGIPTGSDYMTKLYCLYNTFNGQRNTAQTFVSLGATMTPAYAANNIFLASGNADVLCSAIQPALAAKNLRATDVTLSRSPWTHTIPVVNAGSQYYAGQANPNAAAWTLDYALTANCWANTTDPTAGAIGTASTPGTGGVPAAGPDGFSLTPTGQFNNWPAANPVLGSLPRTNVLDLGAFSYPSVDAGTDQTVTQPTSSVTVTGTTCDAGLTPRTSLVQSYAWSQASGPATVSFGTPSALTTTVSGLTAVGTYVLRLQYSVQPDTGLSSPTYVGSDTVTITVKASNQPPVLDSITSNLVTYEGLLVNLAATTHDPNGDTLGYAWTQTAGQAGVSPTGANTASYSFTTPQLTSRSGGTMGFQVVVSDGNGGNTPGTAAVQVYMAGDVTHDWFVNVGDLQVLVAAWGSQKTPPSGNWNGAADLNADGSVNISDLQLLVASWGRSL